MSKSAGLVPFNELEGYRSDTLSWDLALPEYVPTDQIGVNVSRIETIALLGGLSHVRVGAYSGDTTQYNAEVTGIDSDGTATMGQKAVVEKAETVRAEETAQRNSEAPDSAYWWGDASVSINSQELNNRALAKARDGALLRDPKVWGRLLDKDIRKGLREATGKQLLGDVSSFSKYTLGLTALFGVSYSGFNLNPEILIPSLLVADGVQQGFSALIHKTRGYPLSERRLSLIPAYQMDRFVAARGLARMSKVVRAL